MKKSLLYILAVFVGSLLFGACDKHDSASDPIPNSCSEFFFTAPAFNSPSGSKVYWNDDGLWWDESGDLVLINGTQLEIYKAGDTVWKTRHGTEPIPPLSDNNYYCCYIGESALNSPEWDPENMLYKNFDLENVIPLVGASKGNLMTLKPCCAVLKIINLDRDISKIVIPVALANKFPYSGDIDPVNALVANPGNKKSQFDNIAPINSTAYVILPMVRNSITTTGQLVFQYKEGGTTITKKTRSAVTIDKGYVYVIDFDAVRQSDN